MAAAGNTFQPDIPSMELIKSVHSEEYLEKLKKEVLSGKRSLYTEPGNTFICAESYNVALLSAGAVTKSIDLVLNNRWSSSCCINRPPGHHAGTDYGMGYCLLNNAAIGARYAQTRYGLKRIAILDWDVHHGNGTQEIFYRDPTVFYCSIHQNGLYPMAKTGLGHSTETGAGEGTGYNLNIPLPKGSGDQEVLNCLNTRFAPAMASFKPQLIIISAGFDGRKGDAQGRFLLSDNGYYKMSCLVKTMAEYYCQGRVVSTLEGGYNRYGIPKAFAAHVKGLMTVKDRTNFINGFQA